MIICSAFEIRSFLKRTFAVTLIISLYSCAGTGEMSSRQINESYYRGLSFDSHGMPAFSEKLPQRPHNRGDDFFLVEGNSTGRPMSYYHIAIKGGRADIKRPFRTVLERTASGFSGGAAFALELLSSGPVSSSEEEAAAVLTFAAISVAVGTAGGITVGLVEGTYEAVVEAGRAMSSSEELISFSHCEYDNRGRLIKLRAFEPRGPGEPPMEMFRVQYSYEGRPGVPSEITVEDLPR